MSYRKTDVELEEEDTIIEQCCSTNTLETVTMRQTNVRNLLSKYPSSPVTLLEDNSWTL
jgi:hypothetical protein